MYLSCLTSCLNIIHNWFFFLIIGKAEKWLIPLDCIHDVFQVVIITKIPICERYIRTPFYSYANWIQFDHITITLPLSCYFRYLSLVLSHLKALNIVKSSQSNIHTLFLLVEKYVQRDFDSLKKNFLSKACGNMVLWTKGVNHWTVIIT